MTAFSPPADHWLIHYPRKEERPPIVKKEEVKKPIRVPEAEQLEDPCRKYIESSEIPVRSNKSLGTDDHFKSAVCSKNLLKVCEKLMTNKEFVSNSIDGSDDDFEELSMMNEKSRMEYYRKRHGNRRDSRSLPASPKMERKSEATHHVNPYFTVTNSEKKTESNISFLTSLFGFTAAKPSEAKAKLTQKYVQDNADSKKVVSSESGKSSAAAVAPQRKKLTPKPNELRELNIFGPTSM